MKLLNVDIFQSVINFFETIKTNFSLEYLLYIFVGLEVLTIIVFSIVAHNVHEMRLTRAVDKINAYLYEVQYINEDEIDYENREKSRKSKVNFKNKKNKTIRNEHIYMMRNYDLAMAY